MNIRGQSKSTQTPLYLEKKPQHLYAFDTNYYIYLDKCAHVSCSVILLFWKKNSAPLCMWASDMLAWVLGGVCL
jgi:hypothetical protein